MKTVVLTSSSAKSRTTMDDRSENRDSCYFPGCRKDTKCNCEICLASINATLDLMPMSVQKSSLTKLSSSKSMVERTPISFNQSILSTPKQSIQRILASPPLKSTAKSVPLEKITKKRKKSWVFGFYIWRIFVGFCLIFAVDSGFSWIVSELLQPKLSPEMVNNIGKQSLLGHDLNDRLGLLQRKLGKVVTGKVSSCSSEDSIWELNQEGPLINSRCKLYKSMAEEVSIWGWPLQTAGLLATGFSSRSLTILSGRITEWPNGKVGFSIRNSNSSWLLGRMSASAVQLDPNTWVLEYRRSSIVENSRLLWTATEFLKVRISGVVGEIKQQFFMVPAFVQQYSDYVEEDIYNHPT
ncbi:ERG2/sigma1 receptor-like [Macleaya cordata]|uniref:ERG2/sigma1 receptor-like n=1 Tax=Macleaya cordata TaxID=56857 RepID=A0A200QYD7_MACCD|nr:ERG2/sigma1 receptor-like [Macleaya cordata]